MSNQTDIPEAQRTAPEKISLHRDTMDLADSAVIARREGRESANAENKTSSANVGLLPMIVTNTGSDDEPELERIICSSISGGADYLNEMPREVSLERITPTGVFHARYLQGPREVAPPCSDELTDEDLRKIAEAFIYSHQAKGQPFQAPSDTNAFISLLNGESIRSQPFVALLRGLYEAGQQSVGQ